MRILVDANVPGADACFGPLGELVKLPGREIDAAALRGIDALVIRSVTQLDAATLETARARGSQLRFVGTCTIGTDHVDQAALAQHGIGFTSAPGCNAEAVVDYVLITLLTLAERQAWQLTACRVGIVGAGNVGKRLHKRLAAMGIECLVCDPPRAEREGEAGFAKLESLIEACDVLCLHTPLVREGPHATHHLLDAARIAALKPGTLLLNAGRGDCIDGQALRQRLADKRDITAALDVWEREPGIDTALRDLVEIATPHIAGYSLDGKLRGTHQVYTALCRHLGLPVRLSLDDLLPSPPLSRLRLESGLEAEEALRLCLRTVYDVRRDHDSLKRESRWLGMAKGFDVCRIRYPLRRECSTLTVELGTEVGREEGREEGRGEGGRESSKLAPLLRGAGFQVTAAD